MVAPFKGGGKAHGLKFKKLIAFKVSFTPGPWRTPRGNASRILGFRYWVKFFCCLFFYTDFMFGTRPVLAVMQKLNKNIWKNIDSNKLLDYFSLFKI